MKDYAYLNTRVAILASQLLSESQLTALLQQPLGQQHTGQSLRDELLNDTRLEPTVIEQAWLIQMLADFQVLVRPMWGSTREWLTYWFHKFDIANLKTIVRGKIAGLTAEKIHEQLLELKPFTTLPIEQLLRTEDISELLRRLEESSYANIARATRGVFEKEHQLYSLDAAIDRHYLLGFIQRMRVLEADQRKYLLPILHIFMDRINLLWLLRYRLAYQLSAAETYYLLIPTGSRLNRQLLQRLVEFNSLAEILANLPEPLYSLLAEAETTFVVDQRLIQETQRVAQLSLKFHHFTLAKIFAYVLLREMEMRQVMAIIKGKRFNLNQDTIALAATNSAALLA
jgi:V/A-type H+-transporting ATPase subunit C